jgi:hypothetical protein
MASVEQIRLRRIVRMHSHMAMAEIASHLGVTPAVILKKLNRIGAYPERIARLFDQIEEMKETYALYLEAQESRKRHTRSGRQSNGNHYKGLRVVRKEEWRPIDGWPYEISRRGRIRNRAGEEIKLVNRKKIKAVNRKEIGDCLSAHLCRQEGDRRIFRYFRVHNLIKQAFPDEMHTELMARAA